MCRVIENVAPVRCAKVAWAAVSDCMQQQTEAQISYRTPVMTVARANVDVPEGIKTKNDCIAKSKRP